MSARVTEPSFSFCVLGSGSRGNCTLLVLESAQNTRFVLIDAGLSPRATAARLAPFGVRIDEISDVILTHLDTDHFYRGWPTPMLKTGVTVHLHRRHRSIAQRAGLDGRLISIFDEPFRLSLETTVVPVHLAHDNTGTSGYVIDHQGSRLGFATDVGRLGDDALAKFVDLHALAIESNYDRDMQVHSGRPVFLKRRIMGGSGHLSNAQSIEAVLRIDARSQLSHVVPLHLSRQCNEPRLVKRLYAECAPHLLNRLTISNQHEPTPLLHIARSGQMEGRCTPRQGEQLGMF